MKINCNHSTQCKVICDVCNSIITVDTTNHQDDNFQYTDKYIINNGWSILKVGYKKFVEVCSDECLLKYKRSEKNEDN